MNLATTRTTRSADITSSYASTSSSANPNTIVDAVPVEKKVAVVTGSNRGIGFAIVEALCKRSYGHVYLTSRNIAKGLEAIKDLKAMGLEPRFHQLDLAKTDSIEILRNSIASEHGGIDLLINNAAEYFPEDSEVDELTQVENTIYINYFGTQKMCKAFIPLMRKDGRIVNITCGIGHLLSIPGTRLRRNFRDIRLTIAGLNELMRQYLREFDSPDLEKNWGKSPYAVSKVGVGALTHVQQKICNKQMSEKNIMINSCHPGYCSTPKGENVGSQSIAEGAQVPLYLALADHGLKGKFLWHNRQEISWFKGPVPDL